jgi:hypothetical protein
MIERTLWRVHLRGDKRFYFIFSTQLKPFLKYLIPQNHLLQNEMGEQNKKRKTLDFLEPRIVEPCES